MTFTELDVLYSHSKNVGIGYAGAEGKLSPERVGEFCGSPIVTLDQRAVGIDAIIEVSMVIEANKSFTSEPVELNILPGEIVCEDGVIRRGTTAEAIGDEFYNFVVPKGTRKVSISEARLASAAGESVTWRPNGISTSGEEFALIHEEAA
jgi:hypothetical protein